MVKVLIIADDFTGALDTGVQFAKKRIRTKVVGKYREKVVPKMMADFDVLVVNAETRHLSAEAAYQKVYEIVEGTRDLKVTFLYKKTDSGLRGNIGKELEASMDASAEQYISFVPAFPEMKRVTVKGIHYIDGTPVSESPFGEDMFEPVLSSDTRDLFLGSAKKVVNYPVVKHYHRQNISEVGIFDATTTDDLEAIMDDLLQQKKLGVLAGCAAFAEVLANKLAAEIIPEETPPIPNNFLVICGSINEITKSQIAYSEKNGLERIALEPEQELDLRYLDQPEGQAWVEELIQKTNTGQPYVIEPGILKLKEIEQYRLAKNISEAETSHTISETLGQLFDKFVRTKIESVIMIVGGDTLAKCIEKENWPEISIHRELYPGVVLSSIEVSGKRQWLISKSGGFGDEKLLSTLQERIALGAL